MTFFANNPTKKNHVFLGAFTRNHPEACPHLPLQCVKLNKTKIQITNYRALLFFQSFSSGNVRGTVVATVPVQSGVVQFGAL